MTLPTRTAGPALPALALAAALLVLTLLAHAPAHGFGFSIFSRYEGVRPANGEVTIPVAEVADGEAHYYRLEAQDREIRFFVVKSSDGVLRAAFDACDVCFRERKGYDQAGDFMICNNCGQRFHSTRINVEKGGCNPAPLNRVYDQKNLRISVADILAGARYF
jgi:uncharacterized membrane protein